MNGWWRAMTPVTAALAVAAGAAPAAADTDPPPTPTIVPGPPPPAPAISGIGSALGQSGSAPAGPLGLPDLTGYTSNLILGQNPVPSAPGDVPATAVPNPAIPSLSAFNPGYLLPQNLEPAAPGEGTQAPGLGANDDIPGSGRIAFLRRIYEMYQEGSLRGALLGQQSPDEFAQQSDAAPPPPPAG